MNQLSDYKGAGLVPYQSSYQLVAIEVNYFEDIERFRNQVLDRFGMDSNFNRMTFNKFISDIYYKWHKYYREDFNRGRRLSFFFNISDYYMNTYNNYFNPNGNNYKYNTSVDPYKSEESNINRLKLLL